MLPLLLHYRNVHAAFGFTRDFGTIRGFGADVAGLLFAPHHLALWGSLDVFRRAERGSCFPGLTIALLVLAGVVFVRDPKHARVRSWDDRAQDSGVLAARHRARLVERRDGRSVAIRAVRIRVLSVTNPIKPLTLSLVLALVLALTSPGFRRDLAARSVLGFYALPVS